MPIYEYRCQGCRRKAEVFFRSFSEVNTPACPHCGSSDLKRLFSRVTVIKSWGSSLNPPDFESLSDVNEDDPEAMREWMHRIKSEMGDEGGELDDLDLLDAGIRPGDDDWGDEGF